MIDTFTEILKASQKHYKVYAVETIVALWEFCITVIRTETKVLTQPYVKANALELMTLFIYTDEKKELTPELSKSPVISRTLMDTVLKFYVDIEFAGQGMFFTKFQFRHSCSQVFRRFWTGEAYRKQVREQVGQEYFERFLNCLINDMTYCLEEGIAKL